MPRGIAHPRPTVESIREANADLVRRFLSYQKNQRGSAARTVYDYAFRLAELVEYLGPVTLGNAKLHDLEGYCQRDRPRCNGQARPATKAKDAAVIRSLYNYLESHELIIRNPARGLHGPKVVNENPHPVAEPTWIQLWSSDLTDEARVVLGLGFFVGLRRMEITSLRVEQVSLLSRRLMHFVRKGGGDDVTPYGEMVAVFEDHHPQLLGRDNAESFLGPLSRFVEARRGHAYLLPWGEQQSILSAKRRIHGLPEGGNDPDWVNREIRRWNRDAGLREYDITPHALRHSCATYLVRAGMPIEMVRVLLNHSSIAVTQRYVKIGMDSVAEWRRRDRALSLVPDRAIDLHDYSRNGD